MMGTRASAAPTRIAVVNAAHDQEAGARLATHLRTRLTLEPTVTPIPAGDLARALEDALAPPRSAAADLDAAAGLLAIAQEALAQFDYPGSLAHLAKAEQRLLATWPSEAVYDMLADVAFERGRIALRQGQRARAMSAFLLMHRLAPERRLDPQRYPPEVIEAHEEAVTHQAQLGPALTLEVTGLLDGAAVYVDGRPAGSTPLTIAIPPGPHYVSGTFAGRALGGHEIDARREQGRVTVKLRFGAVTIDDRARHWRQGLAGRGPLAPTLAMELGRGATDFTGAEAALVIAGGGDGTLHLSRYDARARMAEPWEPATAEVIARALRAPEDARAAFADPALSPGLPGPARDDRPWYRKPMYRGLVNTGIAVSVAAILIYAVLENPSTVDGVCCTIPAGRVPGSFGFSF